MPTVTVGQKRSPQIQKSLLTKRFGDINCAIALWHRTIAAGAFHQPNVQHKGIIKEIIKLSSTTGSDRPDSMATVMAVSFTGWLGHGDPCDGVPMNLPTDPTASNFFK